MLISTIISSVQTKAKWLGWFRKRKKEKIDEGLNVVAGISKAKALYKELIITAHPDRHPEEVEIYQEITDRITANRYNYNELLKIKQEIIQSSKTK